MLPQSSINNQQSSIPSNVPLLFQHTLLLFFWEAIPALCSLFSTLFLLGIRLTCIKLSAGRFLMSGNGYYNEEPLE